MDGKIRNKDIKAILEIPYIMQQVVSLERRCRWERERMRNTTQHFSASPPGGGSKRVLDDAVAAIDALTAEHGLLLKRYEQEIRKAERTISAIRSVQMRAMVTLLYLDGIRPGTVQEVLHMSRYAFEKARTTLETAEDMESVRWVDWE